MKFAFLRLGLSVDIRSLPGAILVVVLQVHAKGSKIDKMFLCKRYTPYCHLEPPGKRVERVEKMLLKIIMGCFWIEDLND